MSPSLFSLFVAFLRAGLISFGGAMPHVTRLVVDQKAWMPAAEFAETVGLCQFVPGPNATNVSVCVGYKLRGVPGALAAATGLLFFPMCFALAIAALFSSLPSSALVHMTTFGMALVGSGLLLGTGLKMFFSIKARRFQSFLIVAGVVVAAGLFRLPLLPVIFAALAIVMVLAWIRMRSANDVNL